MSETTDKLRTAAAQLRSTELDPAAAGRAADALDKIADDALATYTRIANWLARAAFALIGTCPVLIVAGIWTDWRLIVTGGVVLATGLALAGLAYVAKAARDE